MSPDWVPITVESERLSHLLTYLPAEEWLRLPVWMYDEIAEQIRHQVQTGVVELAKPFTTTELIAGCRYHERIPNPTFCQNRLAGPPGLDGQERPHPGGLWPRPGPFCAVERDHLRLSL